MDSVWLGDLLADSDKAYCSATHISWGEITVGSIANPSMVQIYLRRSKCSQFSKADLSSVMQIASYSPFKHRVTPGCFVT